MVYIVCACSKFASGAVICFVELVKVLWKSTVARIVYNSSKDVKWDHLRALYPTICIC